MKYTAIIFLIVFTISDSFAQKEGYEHLTNVPPPHFTHNQKERKFRLNGILLSPSGKHLVIDYGRKASTLAIFSFPDFTLIDLQRIEKSVELSQSYFSKNDSLLFVKEDRYAPEYSVISFYEKRRMNITCQNTPRGCPTQAAGFAKIRTYSPGKKYLLQRSSDNKSILEVYKRK